MKPQEDIAIVGLSCRFPGEAATPQGFWNLLKNGLSGFSEPTTRYNADAFHHPQTQGTRQNVIPVKGGYFLKQDPYVFDAAFFNITATEAMALDPRQRIAMEVAYEALENAGITLSDVKGTQTSCFLGVSMSDYRDAISRDYGNFLKYQILGISDEMIANRISHFLDIHGPSATVQSACSSSLVAAHVACQSLRSGDANIAIAGGVGLITLTDGTMHLNNLGFLNPKGESRSFDADANGYGRGEGCGVVILKRLDDAIRDGDTIRAVIRGTGLNSDGWTQGVTMPSLEAQAALIKQVYEANGLDYGSTQYVEAHGTGTKVGDPIETKAIYSTIGQSSPSSSRKKLYVGSLKPNIGHLEAAAGVASIIKGVLSLERGLIPPNINFDKPNPKIPLDEWNIVVPTKLTPWPAAHTKRMSISGFGMGGTNGHVILDAYTSPKPLANGHFHTSTNPNKKRIFPLSSHDKAGFVRLGKSLSAHLEALGSGASSPAYLSNLSHTLAKARSGLVWRSTTIASNTSELLDQLSSPSLGEDAVRTPSAPPRIGFVFTGQGAQWARMGIELLSSHPTFAASVGRSTEILKSLGCEWDAVTELSRPASESRLGIPEISQPICSVLQIALVDELRSWGVKPAKVVGHSSGEIAAAYAIGALSHRDALAGAYFRGVASASLLSGSKKSQSEKGAGHGMMAVGFSRDEAQKVIKEKDIQGVTIACINSPSNVTLSGDASALDDIKRVLDEKGVFARRLKVQVAYHSPQMHLCSQDYYASIAHIDPITEDSSTPEEDKPVMISSVLGYQVDTDQLGPYYWVQNLINPVQFTDALREMVSPEDSEDSTPEIDLLVEIGPHSALAGPAEQILSHYGIKSVPYTSMLVRNQSATDTTLNLAADLFRRGVPISIPAANGDSPSSVKLLTDLPPYAWNHSSSFNAITRFGKQFYFPDKGEIRRSLLGSILPALDEKERIWRGFIKLSEEPWLRDHKAGGKVLFPAAGMVSLAVEAAGQILAGTESGKKVRGYRFRDVGILAAMVLEEKEESGTEVVVSLRPQVLSTAGNGSGGGWWEYTVSSAVGANGQLRTNSKGLVTVLYEEGRSAFMKREDDFTDKARIEEFVELSKELVGVESVGKQEFYEKWVESGMEYGEVFQGIEAVKPASGKATYQVRVLDVGETFTRGKLDRPFLISPATLDAAWQSNLAAAGSESGKFGYDKKLLLPTFIGELEISADVPGEGVLLPGAARSHAHGFNEVSIDINLFDEGLSRVIMSLKDLRLSQIDGLDEAGEGSGQDENAIDPANISAEIVWDYDLRLLKPDELAQALVDSGVKSADEAVAKVSGCLFTSGVRSHTN